LLAVNFVDDDVPTCIAARHDVIDGAFELDAESPGIDRFAGDDQGVVVRPYRVGTVTEMSRVDDPSERRFEPPGGAEWKEWAIYSYTSDPGAGRPGCRQAGTGRRRSRSC
jgi:hypothetical protein